MFSVFYKVTSPLGPIHDRRAAEQNSKISQALRTTLRTKMTCRMRARPVKLSLKAVASFTSYVGRCSKLTDDSQHKLIFNYIPSLCLLRHFQPTGKQPRPI